MNKEDFPRLVQAMQLLKAGRNIHSVSLECHINEKALPRLWHRYQQRGEMSLLEPAQKKYVTAQEKESLVTEIINKGLSLCEASIEYDMAYTTLRDWMIAYKERGLSGLERKNKAMTKKKAYTEEQLDELEMLRRRNEYLEAENALLKKVKALVEEREARLRATGRKPSKD